MQITEFKYDCFDPILPLLGEKSSKIESGIYYYHADHLGSSSVVTDKNGKFHEHLEYFPYGETWINDRANNEDLPYRFTGKELDPETGLYFYGARYYDAKLSRWISADPPLATGEYLPNGNKKHDANLPGMGGVFNSINLDAYQYCGQNPVKYVDPDGNSFYTKTYRTKKLNNTISYLYNHSSSFRQMWKQLGQYSNNENIPIVVVVKSEKLNGRKGEMATAIVTWEKDDTVNVLQDDGSVKSVEIKKGTKVRIIQISVDDSKHKTWIDYAHTIAHEVMHAVDAMLLGENYEANQKSEDRANNKAKKVLYEVGINEKNK